MLVKSDLIFVSSSSIDTERWNDCVSSQVKQPIYGMLWYLNLVAPKWEALIASDYSFIWPLPISKKMGVKYVYQPFFTQQLGPFSKEKIPSKILAEAWSLIKSRYKYAHVQSNVFAESIDCTSKIQRITHHLDLNRPYDSIYKGFSTNLKRNIKKGIKAGINIRESSNIEGFIEQLKADYHVRFKGMKEKHYLLLKHLFYGSKKKSIILEAHHEEGLAARALFIKDNSQIIYLAGAITDIGKKTGAMPLIFNKIIEENASSPLYLDFEGSMVDSIARFFKSFGSEVFYFDQLSYNFIKSKLKDL